jgi:arsenate reductase
VSKKTYNVLFLCTGNSARSVMAEAILNHEGGGRFRAYSAGSTPTGRVNPHARAVVESCGFPLDQFRSKSWDEFARADAPSFDVIITVCDNAAGEVCPIWPGHPTTSHWGIPDPAAAQGTDAQIDAAFAEAADLLRNRIRLFVNLPLANLDAQALKAKMREIHETADTRAQAQ